MRQATVFGLTPRFKTIVIVLLTSFTITLSIFILIMNGNLDYWKQNCPTTKGKGKNQVAETLAIVFISIIGLLFIYTIYELFILKEQQRL
tara:strand:- start:5975 stop:6244 length:270 start_codon:yes stop_codon:yes gene_type:complete